MLVRLRFPIMLLCVVGVIAYWPWIRNHFDRLTGHGGAVKSGIAGDIEYWCPMCPGVISDWPAKCPVCHMELVRRTKGEPTPLPDGVVARMQFTPYRVQLAGIRTAAVEFKPLEWEARAGGRLDQLANDQLEIVVDVPASGLAAVQPGLEGELHVEPMPARTFIARVRDVGPNIDPDAQTLRIRLIVLDPRHELKPGAFAMVRLRVPLSRIDAFARRDAEEWRDRSAADLALRSLVAFAGPVPGVEVLLDQSCRLAFRARGLLLAIPAASVIDTGERKVVFVERMAGMFDGLEVTLGARCGDFYPVVRGLNPGERIVTAGAFLLDAETRLNPSLAASYFGAATRPSRPAPSTPAPAASDDEKLIARQKICPVTDEELGSMGAPVKVMVEGRPVYICCKACERELRANAKKYLTKIPLQPSNP